MAFNMRVLVILFELLSPSSNSNNSVSAMETLGKDVTLVSLLLTMNIFHTFSRAFITNFDQVNVYWVEILLGQKCLGKNVAYD